MFYGGVRCSPVNPSPHTDCTSVLNPLFLPVMCVYRNCVVLPGVLRAVEVPFDLGGVMPTWAVMPLLQEPDWDIWANAVAFWPASSYWPCAWEEEEDEEGFQREELLLGSMLASSSSSTFFKSWAPAQLLLTSGSACLDLLPFWDWRVVEMDVILKIMSFKHSAHSPLHHVNECTQF